jgi:hypothetical protein
MNETRKQNELQRLFIMELSLSRYSTVANSPVLQVGGKKLNIAPVRH